jgi:ferrous iron transport protein A
MAVLSLNEMKRGETGFTREIRGGYGFVKRMASMNIRIGKQITKLNTIFRRGPVTIQIDNTQLALGFGMANRILVEVERR